MSINTSAPRSINVLKVKREHQRDDLDEQHERFLRTKRAVSAGRATEVQARRERAILDALTASFEAIDKQIEELEQDTNHDN